jgi:EmrB/QacA subfamily drug resistance transporter
VTASTTAAHDPAGDSGPTAGPGLDRLDPALVKLALVLMLGSFASGLDTTIVTVALDRLSRGFDVSVATVQWVSTGYLLALTMIMPLTGWAIGRFGARATWLGSLGTFLLGSTLCGIAWSMPALIAFRVLQGLGGGMLLPLIRVILGQAAGKQRMGRAMVYIAVPGGLTPVLGPVLGGLVVSALGWRWAFYINAPICLAGLVLAWRLVPGGERGTNRNRLDLLGLGLLSAGLSTVVDGLAEAGNRGSFAAAVAWLPLAVGAVLLAGYTIHALTRRGEPIIDLRLFTVRAFTASSILQFLLSGSLFGTVFLLPLYYQQARHASVLDAGLLLAPLGAGTALAMTYVGKLIDRTGAERTITLIAMVLAIAGLVPYTLLGTAASPVVLGVSLFITGLGQGAIKLTAFTITFRGLAPEQVAPASSANRVLQQLGGVLGTVMLALILQHNAAAHTTPAAFGHTFTWALGLTALAIIPALALPPRPRPHVPPRVRAAGRASRRAGRQRRPRRR